MNNNPSLCLFFKYTKIGSFNNCTSLVKVSIPSHIERIEALSFALCPNLSAVNLAEGLKLIDFRAFYGSGITDIIIPSTVTYISEGAFSNCLNLKCSGISFTKSVSNSDRLPVFIDENFLGTDEESRDCQKSLQQSLLADSIPSHHRKLLAGKTVFRALLCIFKFPIYMYVCILNRVSMCVRPLPH